MAQSTAYKRSLSGSIGAGMKSIMGNGGRRFYILEHKVSSKYHRAGESQRIIVDQIELGRDPSCQVRFDESFSTVSRRHAAIVKDGDNWKLVQLSQTNSTYLNGRKIDKEWYLQTGDEIQLSTNGPKLGFIVPAGDKSLVKSIGMTARLDLFRQQALRPYKGALATLAVVLVLCCGAGGWLIHKQSTHIDDLLVQQVTLDEQFRREQEQYQREKEQDSIENAELKTEIKRLGKVIKEEKNKWEQAVVQQGGVATLLESQNVFNDVYFLVTEKVVYIENGTEHQIYDDNQPYGWSGTGFLLNDGRFVTARHCVEGWLYQDCAASTLSAAAARYAASANNDFRLKAYFIAVSSKSGHRLAFTSDDFTINRSLDKVAQIGTDDYGNPINWRFTFPVMEGWPEKMWATDWAYTTKTDGLRGGLKADTQLSQSLIPMQKLVVLGFPKGLGVGDGETLVEPITSELTTSRRGLAKNGCILHSRGTDHGNSGGPILALKDNKLVVIGIVSRGDVRTEEHNWAVPICNIY